MAKDVNEEILKFKKSEPAVNESVDAYKHDGSFKVSEKAESQGSGNHFDTHEEETESDNEQYRQ